MRYRATITGLLLTLSSWPLAFGVHPPSKPKPEQVVPNPASNPSSLTLPNRYVSMARPEQPGALLEDFVLLVNGERRLLKPGATLNFVRGDTLRIEAARLQDPSQSPSEVNLVGFLSQDPNKPLDDRGVTVDTALHLRNSYWAVDEKKESYLLAAATGRVLHGYSLLRRVEPQLRWVEVAINKQPRVMRPGDKPFRLRADDLFQVNRVMTNIDDEKTISWQLDHARGAAAKDPAQARLHFRHRSHTFATIEMVIDPVP